MSNTNSKPVFRQISAPSQLTQTEQVAKKTRAFVGNGTAFLVCPGLLSLVALAVGTNRGRVPMPLTEDRLHMVHPDESEPRERVTEQLFTLEREGYDDPILLRSELSNSGKWQRGVTFYVTGEWEEATIVTDTPPADAAPATTPDSSAPSTSPVTENAPGVPPSPPASEGTPPNVEPEKDNTPSIDETFNSLPEELQSKLAQLGSIDKILAATNEDLKAVGITGGDITRVKNALRTLTPAAN